MGEKRGRRREEAHPEGFVPGGGHDCDHLSREVVVVLALHLQRLGWARRRGSGGGGSGGLGGLLLRWSGGGGLGRRLLRRGRRVGEGASDECRSAEMGGEEKRSAERRQLPQARDAR